MSAPLSRKSFPENPTPDEILNAFLDHLANIALRDGAHPPVDDVIMDEFHYYSDHSRGTAWQIPLLTLPRTLFLLMSATLAFLPFL